MHLALVLAVAKFVQYIVILFQCFRESQLLSVRENQRHAGTRLSCADVAGGVLMCEKMEALVLTRKFMVLGKVVLV